MDCFSQKDSAVAFLCAGQVAMQWLRTESLALSNLDSNYQLSITKITTIY